MFTLILSMKFGFFFKMALESISYVVLNELRLPERALEILKRKLIKINPNYAYKL